MTDKTGKPLVQRVGRPPGELMEPEDADYIKTQIKVTYDKLVLFYKEAFDETKQMPHKGWPKPKGVETVERAFKYAFSGERPLHDRYWEILELLLNILPEHLPSKKRQNSTSASPSVPTKPLSEMLNNEPSNAIRLHLLAVIRDGGSGGYSLNDFARPDTVRKIAEKLTSGPLNDFLEFFREAYDCELQIKPIVARCINDSQSFRRLLAGNVAQSKYLDVIDWFIVFSQYCSHEMARDVESAFLAYSNDPAFKNEYEWRPLHHLVSLIKYFSRYECVASVNILKTVCFLNNGEKIRSAAETKDGLVEIAMLASLIGKNTFRTSLTAAVGKKAAAQIIGQLKN